MDVATVVVATVAVALLFAFINGFHDAANSIAAVVSTRVLSPGAAVAWAALFNFLALFVFHDGVAETISSIVRIRSEDPAFVLVVLTGLLGAIAWNLLTWWWGLPSSSSHALIGGVSGAAVAYGGWGLLAETKLLKIAAFIALAPLLGFALGSLLLLLSFHGFRRWRPRRVDRTFRAGQLLSAAAYAVGHGGNDAQKTMGVILAVLIAGGELPRSHLAVPAWVAYASYGALALGTAVGGWRIVKTMGMGLTRLRPVSGFCAELAGAITLFATTALHIPVSTTQTITGAIVGVGSVTKVRGIRWGLAQRIVWAWALTIPAAALVGAGGSLLVRALHLAR
jgi:inorganic phosphate transporter, PiT family